MSFEVIAERKSWGMGEKGGMIKSFELFILIWFSILDIQVQASNSSTQLSMESGLSLYK